MIVLSAKHGQSPQNAVGADADPRRPDHRRRSTRPGRRRIPARGDLVAFAIDDDAMLIWLQRPLAPPRPSFAKTYLLGHSGVGNDINGNPKPYTSSGPRDRSTPGADAAAFFGVPAGDARVPDVIGIAQHGSVYTGKQGKIAEHGGDNPQDRDVPILVSGRPLAHGHWRHIVDSPGRDDADRPDDPAAARPRPAGPAGRPGGAHAVLPLP